MSKDEIERIVAEYLKLAIINPILNREFSLYGTSQELEEMKTHEQEQGQHDD